MFQKKSGELKLFEHGWGSEIVNDSLKEIISRNVLFICFLSIIIILNIFNENKNIIVYLFVYVHLKLPIQR